MTSTKPEEMMFSRECFRVSNDFVSNSWVIGEHFIVAMTFLKRKKTLADICFEHKDAQDMTDIVLKEDRGQSSIGAEVQCKQNCFFKSCSFSSFVTRDIRVVVDVKMFVIEIPYCFKHFLECSRRLVPSKALSETSINWTELFHMFFKHSFSLNYSLVGIYVKVEPRKMKRTKKDSILTRIRSYDSLVISTWVRFFFTCSTFDSLSQDTE